MNINYLMKLMKCRMWDKETKCAMKARHKILEIKNSDPY